MLWRLLTTVTHFALWRRVIVIIRCELTHTIRNTNIKHPVERELQIDNFETNINSNHLMNKFAGLHVVTMVLVLPSHARSDE